MFAPGDEVLGALRSLAGEGDDDWRRRGELLALRLLLSSLSALLRLPDDELLDRRSHFFDDSESDRLFRRAAAEDECFGKDFTDVDRWAPFFDLLCLLELEALTAAQSSSSGCSLCRLERDGEVRVGETECSPFLFGLAFAFVFAFVFVLAFPKSAVNLSEVQRKVLSNKDSNSSCGLRRLKSLEEESGCCSLSRFR